MGSVWNSICFEQVGPEPTNCKYTSSQEPPFLANLSNGSTIALPLKDLCSNIFSEELLEDCIRYWRGEVSLAAFYSEFNFLKSHVEIDPFEFRKQRWSWRQFSRVCSQLLSNCPEYSSHDAFGGLIGLSEQSEDYFANFIKLEKNYYINMELLWLIPCPSLLTLRLLRIVDPEPLTVQLVHSVSQLVIRCAQKGLVPSLTDLCLNKLNEFYGLDEVYDLPPQLKRRKRFLKS